MRADDLIDVLGPHQVAHLVNEKSGITYGSPVSHHSVRLTCLKQYITSTFRPFLKNLRSRTAKKSTYRQRTHEAPGC